MAQKVSILLVDDIDGSEAEETVTFGLDGNTYEIDLNKDNAKKLRYDLETWVGSARKVGKSKRKAASAGGARQIRQWAKDNGYQVSDRGVVPADVRAAYEAAH